MSTCGRGDWLGIAGYVLQEDPGITVWLETKLPTFHSGHEEFYFVIAWLPFFFACCTVSSKPHYIMANLADNLGDPQLQEITLKHIL